MARMFDEQELLEQVDGDIEFLADTVEMLAGDGPDLATQIRQAIASGDAEAVGRHAHTLKGMVSNFCASETQTVALQLEQAGKTGDLSAAPSLIDQLETRVHDLHVELEAFVKAQA